MNILTSTWATNRAGTTGFVVTENETGKRRIRVSSVSGVMQSADEKFVAEWGATLSVKELEHLIATAKKKD